MSKNIPQDYAHLLADVKERVRAAQYAALKAVNKELVGLYWDIGRMIAERQKVEGWGKSVVQRLAVDLQAEFRGVGGLSSSNLWKESEKPSIGIVLCKEKNRTVVEYALHDAGKPMGVATYHISKQLPKELKGQLPSPQEIARLLEIKDL